MKQRRIHILSTTMLVALVVTSTLLVKPVSLSASERTRRLHVRKDCSQYTGTAGSFCTVSASNVAAIPVGSIVFYDQAAGNPTGLLDSNIVLDAGNGNRAVGRCTLDLSTNLALCLFFDGTGTLAGFMPVSMARPVPLRTRLTIGTGGTASRELTTMRATSNQPAGGHVRLLSSEPSGCFAPPKFTRAWEPTLLWNHYTHNADFGEQKAQSCENA